MNIFYLDQDCRLAAQYHCDKHVVKMILESAQLLSTAHRMLDGEMVVDYSSGRKRTRWVLGDEREKVVYSASHINHPSAIWVRESSNQYHWLWSLYRELCEEYTHRYDKIHKSSNLIEILYSPPNNIPHTEFYQPPQAMPDDVKVAGDSVQAYRNYYKVYKSRFATWKKREIPVWYK